MKIQDLLPLLRNVTGSQGQYSACCPSHDDKRASLSITEKDGKILLNCHAGCSVEDITASLGLSPSDLFHDSKQKTVTESQKSQQTAEYLYHDMEDKPILKKVRYANKSFCWYHLKDGQWEKGRGGIEPPMYNQNKCKDNHSVYFVEGEKDVNTLAALDRKAVSLPDGAKSKWREEYTDFFNGKVVAILPDNDEPGRKYAQMIADQIADVADVRIVDLSKIWENMPEHADITDFLNQHGSDSLKDVETEFYYSEQVKAKSGSYSLADVESKKTEWLWYPYIPLGKITIISADPGTGKTFFCLYLASKVSTGQPFYGRNVGREPSVVFYQTAEDGIEDTIKPRLEPMYPNFKNIRVIDERNESLDITGDYLEKQIKRYKPSLIVFDPLQAYLGAEVDMHRANQVRPVMAKIARLAEQYNVAMIFIMHNSKMGQNKALYRGLGSIDIPAIARSMLIMSKDPEEPKERLICHEKSSLAPNGDTIRFHIDSLEGGIVFDGFCDTTADEALTPKTFTRDKPSVKKDEVSDLLLELLEKNDGAASMEQIEKLKNECGCSQATMYRAKDDLKIRVLKIGFSKNKKTWWIHPDEDMEEKKAELLKEQTKKETEKK